MIEEVSEVSGESAFVTNEHCKLETLTDTADRTRQRHHSAG